MMFPTLDISATTQQYRYMTHQVTSLQSESLNHPEENDETLGEEPLPSANSDSHSEGQRHSPASSRMEDRQHHDPEPIKSGYRLFQPFLGLPEGYSLSTPFHSCSYRWQSTLDPTREALHHPSFVSSEPEYHSSLPSYRVSPDYPSYPGHREKSQSLPTQSSYSTSSLEKPNTLCSIQPCSTPHGFYLPHYPCGPRGPACCAQGPVGHMAQHYPWLEYRPPGPGPRDCLNMSFTQSGYPPPQPRPRLTPPGAPLSLEQRKAFVTYEADSDKHVEEIIKFVALLRHNGFDMHIDVFEQQFRSISTIDFMEKYISEKDYLIIIAISPKYYETVSGSRRSMENDERTVNTVYIHKQLQNEFIQNGSRNFRFIPILFPGAKKCHVPTWLQNTHVYSWPRDRDDILRRLMRVEKYNPPPIGELPTIISIPL